MTLTDVLGVKYPIIQGGLAYVANGLLAAAVSEAGGFGQVGAAGRTPEAFREQIRIARTNTTKPFGANIPVSRHTDNSPYIRVVQEERDSLSAVSLSAGDPRPYVDVIHAAGLKVMLVVATVRQALRAQDIGGDVIICEGFEAGGHDGPAEETVFSLVPQVARQVHVPVVAAGGIATGQQMMAAFMLGASGIQMGTRFVATTECEAHAEYKTRIVEAGDDGTIVIERSLGVSTRVLRNEYALSVLESERRGGAADEIRQALSGSYNHKAAIEGDTRAGYMYAGQSAGLIADVVPVRIVIERLVQEAKVALSRREQYQSWLS